MMACYRNASMLMHVAVAATDAVRALAAGQIESAGGSALPAQRTQSLWALIEETPKIRRLARRRKRSRPAMNIFTVATARRHDTNETYQPSSAAKEM